MRSFLLKILGLVQGVFGAFGLYFALAASRRETCPSS